MAPHYKQRRPQSTHSSGRKPATRHKTKRQLPVPSFNSSRIQDVEEGPKDVEFDEDSGEEESQDDQTGLSSEDEEDGTRHTYATLLQHLKPKALPIERPNKRRRLENGDGTAPIGESTRTIQLTDDLGVSEPDEDNDGETAVTQAVEDETDAEDVDSDNEEFTMHDPFEKHYSKVTEAELNAAVAAQVSKSTGAKSTIGHDLKKITTTFADAEHFQSNKKQKRSLQVKHRLATASASVTGALRDEETDLMHEMFAYRDILYGNRSLNNFDQLRDLAALHSMNHILKTRDKVLKNNAKLSMDESENNEYRDQGFTRPKVLVLVPTKQACVRFVESIVKLNEPEQQENKSRFIDTFSLPHDDSFQNKPGDFRELFSGNHEEDFRVGLKFTRKTMKFFSGFYNSDIILASPLGMMRTITTGGGKKDSKKEHDADFLSSIEIVIMDHANALEMQNWQHVDYVFSQLNLLPKESHGCNFARARSWYLDGKAKYLRQTVIISEYLTPSILSLASAHLHNISGQVKYTPLSQGAMLQTSPSIPFTITQAFVRFDSSSPHTDSDIRFKYFTTTILPSLLRSKSSSRGSLLFVPTYLDFVRLRNYFSTAAETTSLSFGTISEYSSRGDVARARSHFVSGRHSIMLYSERAHHYFRYKIKGVRKLVFYGVPENPAFWTELVEMLGMNAITDLEWAQNQRGKQEKGLVRAVFSKWDFMKLERIVGTERIARLVSEREGDVFEFV